MTRRVIAYKGRKDTILDGCYFVSQEFNGDKDEVTIWNPHTAIKVGWKDVIKLFDKINSLHSFREAVRKAEDLYTYENIKLKITYTLPKCEEIWMLIDGKLQLYSKYGELISR